MSVFVFEVSRSVSERGNVLFLILIAVALFAALSYAITSSSRSTDQSATSDTLKIRAAEIVEYAGGIDNAVTRLTLTNGCDATTVSFQIPSNAAFNSGNTACKVFHPNGGAVSYRKGDAKWKDPSNPSVFCGNIYYNAWNEFKDIGTSGQSEWTLFLNCVSRDLCLEINNRFGITNPGGEPPTDINADNNLLPGVTAATIMDGMPILGDTPELKGQRDFCFTTTSMAGVTGNYYVHILLPR